MPVGGIENPLRLLGVQVPLKGFKLIQMRIVKNKQPAGHDEIPVIIIGMHKIRNDNAFLARGMDHLPLTDIHPSVADMGTAIPPKKK